VKEVLDKLSSYNLFNYLLPGVLFAVLSEHLTRFSFKQPDIIISAFVYYFIGLVISRVGSLIVEPLLKTLRFVQFADYKDFVTASDADQTLEVLSEQNNSYRTLCSTFLLLLALKLYDRWTLNFPAIAQHQTTALIAALAFMFVFAHRKQSNYINRRVAARQATKTEMKGKSTTA
jgi:hypothetical protein